MVLAGLASTSILHLQSPSLSSPLPCLTLSEAVGGAPADDQTLLQQLKVLRREKDDRQGGRAEQLAPAANNLHKNQQHQLSLSRTLLK